MAATNHLEGFRKPNFFIVGAPRCGTTAMYEYLRQHPDIFMPDLKEPHFFGSDLTKKTTFVHHQLMLADYLGLFDGASCAAKVGEASVLYLKSVRAPLEIREFSPSAKIIIMLRNPVDMMYSLYTHHIYSGAENIQDFEAALEAEAVRRCGQEIPKGGGILDFLLYRDVARFAEQVERYFAVFGGDNVHVIVYDELNDDTAGVYKRTLEFLGVNSDFAPNFSRVYGNRRIRSRLLRFLWTRRPYVATRLILDRANTSSARGALIRILSWMYSRPAPRVPLEHTLRRKLQEEFAPDLKRLSELLGRDLTSWCKD